MAPLYHVKTKSRLDGGSMHPPSARCRKRLPSPARVLRGDAAPHAVKFAKRRVSPVLPIRDQVTSVRQSASELFRRQYLSEGGGI